LQCNADLESVARIRNHLRRHGLLRRPLRAMQEQVSGTAGGTSIRLAGSFRANPGADFEDVAYDLTFDSRTQHLTGTRNGQPFWAAPFIQKGPGEGCGPAMQ